jgi:adenosylcobinamide-phosphate synthase
MARALSSPLVVLALALFADAALGEPPRPLHPVVWMGRAITRLEQHAPASGAWPQLTIGVFIALVVPLVFALAGGAVLSATAPWPLLHVALSVLLLKSSFALRALGQAAGDMRDLLGCGRLDAARGALWSLCSRDARQLDGPLLVAATVESVAENVSDSFVAPLCYYVLFGVPGAVFYRAANTADAMIGYRGRYEHLGKAAARLDDALNLVPARITAALLLAAGWFSGRNVRQAWRVFRRDGARTESPNAGRLMAAMAGLLCVQLEKRGHYRLGDALEPLMVAKIDEAWQLARLAAGLATGGGMIVLALSHAGTH